MSEALELASQSLGDEDYDCLLDALGKGELDSEELETMLPAGLLAAARDGSLALAAAKEEEEEDLGVLNGKGAAGEGEAELEPPRRLRETKGAKRLLLRASEIAPLARALAADEGDAEAVHAKLSQKYACVQLAAVAAALEEGEEEEEDGEGDADGDGEDGEEEAEDSEPAAKRRKDASSESESSAGGSSASSSPRPIANAAEDEED